MQISNNSFVHLHSHSCYSILDANNRVDDYVKQVKENGQTACALTDHGVMYGMISFYHACEKYSVKPILGCEVYVAPKSRFDKDPKHRYNHLVLLAENNEGFNNLQKICSQGFIDADAMYYGKPRVDDEVLAQNHTGIIALSACLAGAIPERILADKYDKAKEKALHYRDLFGKDNFFLEIQDHNDKNEELVAQQLYKMSKETGIPLVATNDCHYTKASDAEAHKILLYMRDQKNINCPSSDYGNGQLYVKTSQEMADLFPYATEAIENTVKIADRCNVTIKFHETKMPKAPVPDGLTSTQFLTEMCQKGLKERYAGSDRLPELAKQMSYELSVIDKMGYTDYFLIVADYCRWARDNGVLVGPGRGSAAGSLVTYCSGITNIEPTKYNLVFERFLNPERVSMPDIDVDFDNQYRYKVVDHVRDLYGNDNVSQIITFGTMASRKVIQSVGKVYGLEISFYSHLSSLVPEEIHMTLKKALEVSTELKSVYDSDDKAKLVIDMAMELEGLPCNTSKHAAGVIICDRPVVDYIPVARTIDGDLVSQYNMIEVEELGLLKMDFLGLKTLTTINNARLSASKSVGHEISLSDIRYDDKKVLDYIGTGNTSGIFQLESKGMQGFMKDLKPRSIEDLIAGISLYRPGPMDFIPRYIEGKNDPSSVTYVSSLLEPILKPTYGCIVYQEQVMEIFRQLAGYSMGGADEIRRAMSKKKQYIIDEHKEIFIHGGDVENHTTKEMMHIPGCVSKGIRVDDATVIYESMADFAKYAFNKSHAACYAIIAYQTAWFKYYYPTEYMAAVITTFIDDPKKLVKYIGEARKQGIKILAPDINKSTTVCEVVDKSILLPFVAIKDVGAGVGEAIVKRRQETGDFNSFAEFLYEYKDFGANKSCIEHLIYAGAFDSFGISRQGMAKHYADVMKAIDSDNKQSIKGQISLFDSGFADIKYKIPNEKEYNPKKRLSIEKEVMGIYLSGHPLDVYKDICDKYSTCHSTDFINTDDGIDIKDKTELKICGIVTATHKIFTKKNQPMEFVTLEDAEGTVDVVIFPNEYEKYELLLRENTVVVIDGHSSYSKDGKKDANIIANTITPIEQASFVMWVQIEHPDQEKEQKIEEIIKENLGVGIVKIYDKSTKSVKKCTTQICITAKHEMETFFGAENVKVV